MREELVATAPPGPWPTASRDVIPDDAAQARLVGRAWIPELGPTVIAVRDDVVVDVGATFATMRELTEHADPRAALDDASGTTIAPLDVLARNTPPDIRDAGAPWLLSPIDLHVVKAAGVTFPVSMLERVVEERAQGDPDAAASIRAEIEEALGGALSTLRPGSTEALRLKEHLVARGWWSQYLEVGLGADAEIFTKAPVLSTVGTLAEVGVLASSEWSNPEPEVVVVVSSRGTVVGATLGNDVNLRDIEGRSALLLGKAKDNNASAAVGPFVRLFDDAFGLDDVRTARVTLEIAGRDGFHLSGSSDMAMISRDPLELVRQTIGPHHAYPDGFALYLGTMFAPTADRGEDGAGFTHRDGDVVSISSPRLGTLVNRVRPAHLVERWSFGIADLMRTTRAGSGRG
jgi:fumarylacetoacetate (FAA) hydrolase family protein